MPYPRLQSKKSRIKSVRDLTDRVITAVIKCQFVAEYEAMFTATSGNEFYDFRNQQWKRVATSFSRFKNASKGNPDLRAAGKQCREACIAAMGYARWQMGESKEDYWDRQRPKMEILEHHRKQLCLAIR